MRANVKQILKKSTAFEVPCLNYLVQRVSFLDRLLTHLPSEDVLVIYEASGESLHRVLVELCQLLAEEEGGLAVLCHAVCIN